MSVGTKKRENVQNPYKRAPAIPKAILSGVASRLLRDRRTLHRLVIYMGLKAAPMRPKRTVKGYVGFLSVTVCIIIPCKVPFTWTGWRIFSGP